MTEYEIIYSDPPWPMQKSNYRKARPKQGKELDYSTLSVEECLNLHNSFIAKAAPRYNIFMWAVDKYLPEIESGMKARGFKLHARFIWDKTNGIAPAFTVRFTHEYLLWFFEPKRMLMPRKECRGKYTTVFTEPSTYHSHKPERVYLMLEDMFPDAAKIELFARNTREGWESWGDQLPVLEKGA